MIIVFFYEIIIRIIYKLNIIFYLYFLVKKKHNKIIYKYYKILIMIKPYPNININVFFELLN
jgi:hypothetical protein